MELNKQNLELVKKLLEDKIDFHLENINYLKDVIERNTPNGFRLSESMQDKHEIHKKALIKAREDRLECYELLDQVLKQLEHNLYDDVYDELSKKYPDYSEETLDRLATSQISMGIN